MELKKDVDIERLVEQLYVYNPSLYRSSEQKQRRVRLKLREQILKSLPSVEVEKYSVRHILLDIKNDLQKCDDLGLFQAPNIFYEDELHRPEKCIDRKIHLRSESSEEQDVIDRTPATVSDEGSDYEDCVPMVFRNRHMLRSHAICRRSPRCAGKIMPHIVSTDIEPPKKKSRTTPVTITLNLPSVIREVENKYEISIDLGNMTRHDLDNKIKKILDTSDESNKNASVNTRHTNTSAGGQNLSNNDDVLSHLMAEVLVEPTSSTETWNATNTLENINKNVCNNYYSNVEYGVKTKKPRKRTKRISSGTPKKRGRKSKLNEKSDLAKYVELFSNGCETTYTPVYASSSTMSQMVTSTTQPCEAPSMQNNSTQSAQIMYLSNGGWTTATTCQLIPSSNVGNIGLDAGNIVQEDLTLNTQFEDFVNYIDNSGNDNRNNVIAKVLDGGNMIEHFRKLPNRKYMNQPLFITNLPYTTVTSTISHKTQEAPTFTDDGVLNLSLNSKSSFTTKSNERIVDKSAPLDLSMKSKSYKNSLEDTTAQNEEESDDNFIRRIIETSGCSFSYKSNKQLNEQITSQRIDEPFVESNESFRLALDMPLLDNDETSAVINKSTNGSTELGSVPHIGSNTFKNTLKKISCDSENASISPENQEKTIPSGISVQITEDRLLQIPKITITSPLGGTTIEYISDTCKDKSVKSMVQNEGDTNHVLETMNIAEKDIRTELSENSSIKSSETVEITVLTKNSETEITTHNELVDEVKMKIDSVKVTNSQVDKSILRKLGSNINNKNSEFKPQSVEELNNLTLMNYTTPLNTDPNKSIVTDNEIVNQISIKKRLENNSNKNAEIQMENIKVNANQNTTNNDGIKTNCGNELDSEINKELHLENMRTECSISGPQVNNETNISENTGSNGHNLNTNMKSGKIKDVNVVLQMPSQMKTGIKNVTNSSTNLSSEINTNSVPENAAQLSTANHDYNTKDENGNKDIDRVSVDNFFEGPIDSQSWIIRNNYINSQISKTECLFGIISTENDYKYNSQISYTADDNLRVIREELSTMDMSYNTNSHTSNLIKTDIEKNIYKGNMTETINYSGNKVVDSEFLNETTAPNDNLNEKVINQDSAIVNVSQNLSDPENDSIFNTNPVNPKKTTANCYSYVTSTTEEINKYIAHDSDSNENKSLGMSLTTVDSESENVTSCQDEKNTNETNNSFFPTNLSILEMETKFNESYIDFDSHLEDDTLSLATSCFNSPEDDRYTCSKIVDEPEITDNKPEEDILFISHEQENPTPTQLDDLPNPDKSTFNETSRLLQNFKIPKLNDDSKNLTEVTNKSPVKSTPVVKRIEKITRTFQNICAVPPLSLQPSSPASNMPTVQYDRCLKPGNSSVLDPKLEQKEFCVFNTDVDQKQNVINMSRGLLAGVGGEAINSGLAVHEIAKVFGVSCLPFLVDKCSYISSPQHSHQYSESIVLKSALQSLSKSELNIAYKFMFNHGKLFRCFFHVFCDVYTKHNNRVKLMNMVYDCEKHTGCIMFLRKIFYSLIDCGLNKVNACRQILNRCRDMSPTTIDVLIGIIFESDWGMFYDYLDRFAQLPQYTFRISVLNNMAPRVLQTKDSNLGQVLCKCMLSLSSDDLTRSQASPDLLQVLELIKQEKIF